MLKHTELLEKAMGFTKELVPSFQDTIGSGRSIENSCSFELVSFPPSVNHHCDTMTYAVTIIL
jgi:hypothetical protein